jgi:hypothetical protein
MYTILCEVRKTGRKLKRPEKKKHCETAARKINEPGFCGDLAAWLRLFFFQIQKAIYENQFPLFQIFNLFFCIHLHSPN